MAGDEIVEDMARGAEAYLQMWERAVGVPRTVCRGAHMAFTARGLGGVALGSGVEQAMRSATQPRSRTARAMQWCVSGKDGAEPGARTVAVLTEGGTVGLIASTGKDHVAKGIRRGTRARRVRRSGARRFGKNVLVRRAARGSGARLVFVMRGKRVKYVAVATGDVGKSRASLRSHLGLTGL